MSSTLVITPGYFRKLEGDLQMACEQGSDERYGWTATDPTYPVGISDTPAWQSPRAGFNELANKQVQEINAFAQTCIGTELIHAREIGQREGREDARRESEQQIKWLESWVEQLRTAANLAAQQPTTYYIHYDNEVVRLKQMNDNQLAIIHTLEKTIATMTKDYENLRKVTLALEQHVVTQSKHSWGWLG